MPRRDPYKNFRFRVEIAGVQLSGFSEVSGLTVEIDAIEYREGSDPTHVRKLPGLTRYSDVTLKCGVTNSLELYEWHRRTVDGDIDRRAVAIVLQDDSGQDVARWQVVEAFPRRYEGPHLDAKGTDVAIETLVLAVEGIERVA
jgi:phage tail-like protein